jgi:hypothetical protein
MYLIPKREVVILDSNLPDIDSNYTQFISGTSYALLAEVQYGQDIFRSLEANNMDIPVAQTTTIKWKFLGKANKWAAFDEFNNTKTKHETKVMYVVESRYVDYIGILNLKAKHVKLELYMMDDDIETIEPLRSYEADTFTRKSANYTEYAINDGTYKRTFLQSIYPYYGTKLKIEITGINVEVGNIIYNRKIDLGMVLANSSFALDAGNLIDIEIDSVTGNIKQVPILPRNDLTIPILMETKDYDKTTNFLQDYKGEACLFVALTEVKNKLPSIAIYGFYKNIRIPIGAKVCEYELLIKGVV